MQTAHVRGCGCGTVGNKAAQAAAGRSETHQMTPYGKESLQTASKESTSIALAEKSTGRPDAPVSRPCQKTLLAARLRTRKNLWRRVRLSARCNADAEGIAGMSAGFLRGISPQRARASHRRQKLHIVRCGNVLGDMTGAHVDARPWCGIKTHLLAARPPS